MILANVRLWRQSTVAAEYLYICARSYRAAIGAVNGESQVIAVGAALSAFSGASQHDRLMRLDFPFKDGPPAILLPNKLVAHEEVSRGFRFDVEVLSDDPRMPLKIMTRRESSSPVAE